MGAGLYPPPISQGPLGVIAESAELDDSAYIDTTEVIVYQQSFTATAGRRYKVIFQAASVDTDATGANTYYGSKGSARIVLHWAAGTSVTTASAQLVEKWVATFGDDSTRSSGTTMIGSFSPTTSGTYTVGVGLNMRYATGGMVRFLMYGNGNKITIEDAGPA